MITFKVRGSFDGTDKFLSNAAILRLAVERILEKYALEGVSALAAATPVDTGLTADSWDYELTNDKGTCGISWSNSNFEYGLPVAILIQYGHGTNTGVYVQGIDYINPAIQPIFDKIAQSIYEEVSNL